jgi:hypothetical protein
VGKFKSPAKQTAAHSQPGIEAAKNGKRPPCSSQCHDWYITKPGLNFLITNESHPWAFHHSLKRYRVTLPQFLPVFSHSFLKWPTASMTPFQKRLYLPIKYSDRAAKHSLNARYAFHTILPSERCWTCCDLLQERVRGEAV